jgi:energy-converting hydrogenase B subunit D
MDEFPNLADMAFDGILALAVLVLAWKLLRSPNLFKAVVLFISFGLMMSLAWVRLKAVDIALAEAAIGAGLTGALFLTALGKLQSGAQHNQENNGTHQQSQEGRP